MYFKSIGTLPNLVSLIGARVRGFHHKTRRARNGTIQSAATARHNLHYRRTWWDGFVAARRSWAALRGWGAPLWLCVSHRSNLHCMRANIGNTPSISQRSVLVAPLCFICIGYHWVSSESSREAEKRPNCEIGSNIMHEWGDDGRDGDIFHCSNRQMTQQTVPKCWGMILEWVQSDGMVRILMTGVIPPHWVRACIY
jgi:hypothetical protein